MSACPNCSTNHAGPRSASDAHHEASHVLTRAAEMRTDDGREFMRTNLLRLGLELSDFCPQCVLNAGVALGPHVRTVVNAAVRGAEEALQAIAGEPLPSNVIPFKRRSC